MGLNYISEQGAANDNVWFLDENGYDVYDDFETYSAPAVFTSNSKWTVTTSSANASSIILVSTEAGGSGKELRMGALVAGGGPTVNVDTATDFVPGKSYWLRMTFVPSSMFSTTGSSASVGIRINGTGGYTGAISFSASGANGPVGNATVPTSILIHYNSSKLWDVYVGGKKILSNQSSVTGFGISLSTSSGSPLGGLCALFIDDVRQAKVFSS